MPISVISVIAIRKNGSSSMDLANWRITWKIVVDDWDRVTRRPDCPWDNSPSYCASSTPNPRISPPGSISERTLCPRRFHPLSSFVDLVDSRTLGASYPRCEPSGTISTWNRAALKIPAKIPCEKPHCGHSR